MTGLKVLNKDLSGDVAQAERSDARYQFVTRPFSSPETGRLNSFQHLVNQLKPFLVCHKPPGSLFHLFIFLPVDGTCV